MPVYRTQVQTNYAGGGGPGFNAFHFRTQATSGGELDTELQSATDALEDFYTAILGGLAGSSVGTDGVWSPVGGGSLPVDVDGWTLSPSTGDRTAPFVSLLVQWRTLRPGRTGRGRSFLGPLKANAIASDGSVSGSLRSSAQTAATASLITPFLDNGDGAFVVRSARSNVASDITSCTVWSQFASLPSRRD